MLSVNQKTKPIILAINVIQKRSKNNRKSANTKRRTETSLHVCLHAATDVPLNVFLAQCTIEFLKSKRARSLTKIFYCIRCNKQQTNNTTNHIYPDVQSCCNTQYDFSQTFASITKVLKNKLLSVVLVLHPLFVVQSTK